MREYITLKLPSNNCVKNYPHKIEISQLNIREIKQYFLVDNLSVYERVKSVLSSSIKLPNDFLVDDLYLNDVIFILINQRNISFNKDISNYELSYECSNCNSLNKVDLDLENDLELNLLRDYEDTVILNDKSLLDDAIEMKLITLRDMIEISTMNLNETEKSLAYYASTLYSVNKEKIFVYLKEKLQYLESKGSNILFIIDSFLDNYKFGYDMVIKNKNKCKSCEEVDPQFLRIPFRYDTFISTHIEKLFII